MVNFLFKEIASWNMPELPCMKISQYYHKTFTILTLSCILLQNGHTYLNIWCLSMRDHFITVCMKGLKLVLFLLFVFLLILPNESPSKIMKNAFYFI